MAFVRKERVVVDPAVYERDHTVTLVHGQPWSREPRDREGAEPAGDRAEPRAVNARALQRADLARLRRRLAEPCELKDRDLLTLLSYAVGGDGDPIVGLLDDTRATIAMLSEVPAGAEPEVFASLERRLAVAMELYARATASDDA